MKRQTKIVKNTSGIAIMAVLIFLIVAFFLGLMLMKISSHFLFTSGRNNRVTETEMIANSGIEMARVDLRQLAMPKMSATDPNTFSNIVSEEMTIAMGLVYDSSKVRSIVIPRFESTQAKNVKLSVYYFPSAKNEPPIKYKNKGLSYDMYFPKTFHVVSEATNMATGEIHSTETLYEVRLGNVSQIAFGMLNPILPPDGISTRFTFKPATYSGHTYFGNLPSTEMWLDGLSGQATYYNGIDGVYNFTGPVTFQHETPTGKNFPGDVHAQAELNFQKGFTDKHKIEIDTTHMFHRIAAMADVKFSASDVCLYFKQTKVEQYSCNINTIDPAHMYGAFIADHPTSQIFYNSTPNGNIWVKGIVAGDALVAAEGNIKIAGDLIYNNGDPKTSRDLFGAVAKNDVVIPASIPLMKYDWENFYDNTSPNPGEINMYLPETTTFIDPDTNFEPSTGNRISGDADYFDPRSTTHKKNHVATLDLDGAYLAAEGGLLVDGIYNYGEFGAAEDNKGWVMTASNGARYNPVVYDQANSYYNHDAKGFLRRAASPSMCITPCPGVVGGELPRRSAHAIRLFGSLVTKDYTFTQKTLGSMRLGFKTKVLKEDPRFEFTPPRGYPETKDIFVDVFWSKSYHAKSDFLKTAAGGKVPQAKQFVPHAVTK